MPRRYAAAVAAQYPWMIAMAGAFVMAVGTVGQVKAHTLGPAVMPMTAYALSPATMQVKRQPLSPAAMTTDGPVTTAQMLVSALRPAQPASGTATPRIRLPGTGTPATPTPTPTATAHIGLPSGTPLATASPASPPGGTPSGATAVPLPGETTEPIAPPAIPGGTAGQPTALPGSLPGESVRPPGSLNPFSPGSSMSSTSSTSSTMSTSSTAADRSNDSVSTADAGAIGPSGLIRIPTGDDGIERMWARFGSPRAHQSWIERWTAGRPGPWGWWPAYVLLAVWFAYLSWRLLRAIGRLQPPRG